MATMFLRLLILVCTVAAASGSAWAQLEVKSAWVRGTVAAQKTTGAYMELKSAKDSSLVGVETPIAAMAEVHEMRMDKNVMHMSAVPKLDLPAGKTVELEPGGYHVMLIDLKKPLKTGDRVPLTLRVMSKDGKVSIIEVNAEVRDIAAMAPMKRR